jgi:hypothetical protein
MSYVILSLGLCYSLVTFVHAQTAASSATNVPPVLVEQGSVLPSLTGTWLVSDAQVPAPTEDSKDNWQTLQELKQPIRISNNGEVVFPSGSGISNATYGVKGNELTLAWAGQAELTEPSRGTLVQNAVSATLYTFLLNGNTLKLIRETPNYAQRITLVRQ